MLTDAAATDEPTCPRCGSPRWVSLDGGWTRRAQCVPCGALHTAIIGPGWRSPMFADPDAQHPAYRDAEVDVVGPGQSIVFGQQAPHLR